MKNCPHCGGTLSKKQEKQSHDVAEMLKEHFNMALAGTNACKRMTAVQVANEIGLPPVKSVVVMIGRASTHLGLRSGRSANNRWIEMPPLASQPAPKISVPVPPPEPPLAEDDDLLDDDFWN